MNCEPVGIVESPVKEGVDKGWGQVIPELYFDKQYTNGLSGIGSFSHIIVIFEMHKSSWDPTTDLVRRPQVRTVANSGGRSSELSAVRIRLVSQR